MKRFLGITTLVLAIGIGGFGCNDKKDNDDEKTLLLLLVAQQQAKASLNASAIAAHPGCSVLNTASTTSQKLTYGTIGGRYEAVIKFTLNAGQKLVITTSAGTLSGINSIHGNSGGIFYSPNACTTGDFTSIVPTTLSYKDNTSDYKTIEITASAETTYLYETTVTDAVTAGATITYQIQ